MTFYKNYKQQSNSNNMLENLLIIFLDGIIQGLVSYLSVVQISAQHTDEQIGIISVLPEDRVWMYNGNQTIDCIDHIWVSPAEPSLCDCKGMVDSWVSLCQFAVSFGIHDFLGPSYVLCMISGTTL